MYFKDKIVWITGASSGIGEFFAYELNKRGAKLIISARRIEELERVKNNCKSNNEIIVVSLDLLNYNDMSDKTKIVLEHFGKVDILINNGGISQRSLAYETGIDVDKKIMEINYIGTIALTKSLLPSMVKNNSGHIVVISSVTGKAGIPLRSAYSASKHALFGFFDTLRAELWKNNIYVTMFCPGFISTNLSINALNKNGNKYNQLDTAIATGMAPEYFVRKALNAIAKKKSEVYIGSFKEKLVIYMRRYLPSLFFKIIRKFQ